MEINKRRNNKNNLMSNKTDYTQNAQRIREQMSLKLHCEIQIFTISQLSKYLSLMVMNQICLQFHNVKHL